MARPYGVLRELLREAILEHKTRTREFSARCLGPVRRITRVAPPLGGRYVAVTFEDGPTAALPRPDLTEARWRGNGGSSASSADAATRRSGAEWRRGITQVLLDTLERYEATGTFAVIGSTAENYPDDEGPIGTVLWNGKTYDHYPEFGQDALAGAVNQPELVRRIITGGHELVNHTYRHVPAGTREAGGRHPKSGRLAGTEEALADLARLHRYIEEQFGYTMRLGRPAGETRGGTTPDISAIYAPLGYNHLSASLDGGGWERTSGAYDHDAGVMVHGLQRALERDPLALRGQVVSLRDGYNRSRESPVVTALSRQMQMLRNYGYKVVTASALIEMSPFTDLSPEHPAFPAARDLLARGYWVAYTSNEVRPDRPVRRGELAVWAAATLTAASAVRDPFPGAGLPPVSVYADVPAGHPYRWHVETAAAHGLWREAAGAGRRPSPPESRGNRIFGLWDLVTVDEFLAVLEEAGLDAGRPDPGLAPPEGTGAPQDSVSHAQALVALWEALGGPDWRS
jgi:peptidoglycan/xylan/chitin deacetylase (PgdA/CDA1 family)